jgi:hypothetical protein
MEEELQWIRRGARAQQSKSKSRVAAYDDMVEEHARIRTSQKFASGVIAIPPAPRLGTWATALFCCRSRDRAWRACAPAPR